MTEIQLTALVGLFGVLSGAFLQAAFNRINAKDDFLRQKKTNAYLKFFEGVANLSHASTDAERIKALAMVAAARGECALYASDAVLKAMTDAWRRGPVNESDLSIHAEMVRQMRRDTLGRRTALPDEILFETIFGAGAEKPSGRL